ncbi:MAG: hypothetical protein K2P81_05935 [Bacteriovoracaceae bacterium]|nr:hypothetical protein [Bacteriovoracaceae bacterium]
MSIQLLLFFFLTLPSAFGVGPSQVEPLEWQEPHILSHDKGTDLRPLATWKLRLKKMRLVKKDDLGVVYDFIAHHTPEGFRLGQKEAKKITKGHLIFVGCSMIYGDGVQDTETTPAQVSNLVEGWHVYNLGVQGASAKEHLYLWRNFSLNEAIKEENGVLLYNHFSDHFERVSYTWRYLSWASPILPVWDYVPEKHDFVYKGINSESIDWKFSQLMNQLGLTYMWLRATSHFVPLKLSNKIPMMIDYLLAIKKEYLRQFPKGRFIVTKSVLNPWVPAEMYHLEETFLKALSAANLEVWDDKQIDRDFISAGKKNDDWMIPRDGHPLPKLHKWNADILAGHIQNL